MIPAELKECSVVVLGSFNPTMFHPYWFQKHGIITKDEADFAINRKDSFQMVLTGPLTIFRTEELIIRI